MKTILVTGSSGLIGSAVCRLFHERGYHVHGLDNDSRAAFFGPAASTRANQRRLQADLEHFTHHELDIREWPRISVLLAELRPDAVVHCAGQPSHDRATTMPREDFDINAGGTINLLEAVRQACPQSPFVFMSTNKVYGDWPNRLPLRELPRRWEFSDASCAHGIKESVPIDQCCHSIFGASKVAADVMVQEYGRLYGMLTCCLRAGCVTGANHAGVELHGFLNYLIACNATGRTYNIHGYGGKQLRDNIHASDVARFIAEFIQSPRPGEVYNIGGGKPNTCSIIEAFELAKEVTGRGQIYTYKTDARTGDHVCYYTDLTKIRQHYPGWRVTISLPQIFNEIAEANRCA